MTYTQKSGNPYKIEQTINVLAQNKAVSKIIQIPEKDLYVTQKIINSNKLYKDIIVKTF